MTATGYEPLGTLKPVADGLWLIDGPPIWRGRVPYPTRATVARLEGGDLWVHSPVALTDSLRAEIDATGPVRHLVAPNHAHVAHLPDWRAAWPRATVWAAPGVDAAAARELRPDGAEPDWAGQLDQIVVRAGPKLREAAFLHRPSRTLILADLIEAHETRHHKPWVRPLIWLAGTDDSAAHMRPRYRWSLRGADKADLADDIEVLLGWGPKRMIIAHGRWYGEDGRTVLEYAFRKVLQARRWERAYDDHRRKAGGDGAK